ncbi:hypothetical protein H6G52_03785 [Limnothrix sp. FACHB-881]|uniref:hypothetical protein n=1 Tax=Limnothrix sp. FACHB-881 TaxID=2692819 RepID=UPI001681D29C|nr:hypothetical protein [Limnothrix sp. FACHB-881]MBD2634472.1 hypothetical protein [Limnothrix sp. FACHB-881]
MSAENIANDQQPINPEVPELEDGELSEAELDAQSGGSGQNTLLQDMLRGARPDPHGNPQKKNEDSSYSSTIGALGTDGNPAETKLQHIPVNLPMTLP